MDNLDDIPLLHGSRLSPGLEEALTNSVQQNLQAGSERFHSPEFAAVEAHWAF